MKRTRGLWASIIFVLILVVASLIGFWTGGLAPQLGLDLQGGIEVILSAPAGTQADTMARTVENIRTRVDAFGVGEPDIAPSGTNILIQIPGSADSTVEERQQTSYCLTGEDDAVYGCSDDQKTADGAVKELEVQGAPSNVCLTVEGDELNCYPTTAAATQAKDGITVQPKASPTPSASASASATSPSSSSSTSPTPVEGPPEAASSYCLTSTDGEQFTCYASVAAANDAKSKIDVTVKARSWCIVPIPPPTPSPSPSPSASPSASGKPTPSAAARAKASKTPEPSKGATPSASSPSTPSPSPSPTPPPFLFSQLDRTGASDLPCQLKSKTDADTALKAIAVTKSDTQYCVVSSAGDDLGCYPTADAAAKRQKETGQEKLLSVIGKTARLEERPTLQVITPSDPNYSSTPLTCSTPAEERTDKCKPENLDGQTVVYPDQSGQKLVLGPVIITGANFKKATATLRGGTQSSPVTEWVVQFDLDGEGSDAFAKATETAAAASPQGQIAIAVDRVVISNPTVQSQIVGTGEITGNFTEDSAKELATVLNAGALPVQLTRESVRTVSPTLGSESLKEGVIAGVAGLILLFLYLLFYYRLLGIVAWFGMSIWAILALALVSLAGSSVGYALSLAGVAGLVISLGVTADSYVVFFERLKDEVRNGRSARAAVQPAFKRAFRTIVAADFVTGIAAVALYLTAVSSVRGFALTLGVATLLDLFVVYFFKRPTVFLIARSKRLTEMHGFGLTSGIAGEPEEGEVQAVGGGGA